MTAEYRSVQTRMWREDDWFQSLETDARLLFIYLFTNPSASIAGIYRLPLRTIEFESGIPMERVKELLDEFSKANKAHYDSGVVWVVKMRENQLPGETLSPKVKVRLDKDVASIPDCPLKIRYLTHYRYPIDTLSIPTSTETDTETDTNTDGLIDAQPPEASLLPQQRTDADMTQAVTTKLKDVGVSLTPYIVDTYMAAALEHGIHAALAGISAAADQGKQQKTSYVLACIRNKVAGDERKQVKPQGKERTNGDNRKPDSSRNNGHYSAAEAEYQLPEQYR
jgi:hypothetical protein